jgi:ribosome-associated protein
MEKVRISTEYITLGQFLKLCNAVDGGGEAKVVISEGLVSVNGEVDTRRGRKLYENDVVAYNGDTYQVVR